MLRSRAFRGAAAFGLAVLVVGLTLPLIGLALPHDMGRLCCGKGRCCCAEVAKTTNPAPCLRRGCACERPGDAVTAAPLQIEAVLPSSEALGTGWPAEARWESEGRPPLHRSDAPAVPPPRRSLLA